jgi:phosphatidylinositol N-acetylglucosaminyltransferase subunit Q
VVKYQCGTPDGFCPWSSILVKYRDYLYLDYCSRPVVHHMTEAILRSSCVSLMGCSGGFKLNTELAELLGMISLNAVQIYSILWFFVGGYLRHIIQVIVSGIILGLTSSVSFFIDIIQLARLHVTILHS